jgi:protein SCO1/2
VIRLAAILCLLALCGCGPRAHEGVGTVVEVAPDLGQVMLAHEEIPGLMPAMTMNFDVSDPALLSAIAAGDRVRFALDVDGSRYRITSFEVLERGTGAAAESGGATGLAAVVPEKDVAPAFALVDQDGGALSLESLRGQVVLLDFIYTTCPGPCPILTSARVNLQKALPDALRPRVRFVSISLDPARDTPEALRGYALARGADLSRWSFLTGPPDIIDGVLQSYGVGTVPSTGGEIEHVLVSFLIDPQGRIAKRYFGLDHAADQYLRDLEAATAG